jgi:DNA-binding XRE family transcriptional regulator
MKKSRLKLMRELLGITQKQLAETVGVKPPTLNVLERKGIFDTRTAVKYAKAMKCNPIFLLDGLDNI